MDNATTDKMNYVKRHLDRHQNHLSRSRMRLFQYSEEYL